MDHKHFDAVLNDVIEAVQDILGSKADEYAVGSDRLHNFKQAAMLQNITPREALRGMLAKHTVSVYDMLNTHSQANLDKWDEKIIDHINYLILLRALIIEEIYQSTDKDI